MKILSYITVKLRIEWIQCKVLDKIFFLFYRLSLSFSGTELCQKIYLEYYFYEFRGKKFNKFKICSGRLNMSNNSYIWLFWVCFTAHPQSEFSFFYQISVFLSHFLSVFLVSNLFFIGIWSFFNSFFLFIFVSIHSFLLPPSLSCFIFFFFSCFYWVLQSVFLISILSFFLPSFSYS